MNKPDLSAIKSRYAIAIGILICLYIIPLAWLAQHIGLLILGSILYTVLLLYLFTRARDEADKWNAEQGNASQTEVKSNRRSM